MGNIITDKHKRVIFIMKHKVCYNMFSLQVEKFHIAQVRENYLSKVKVIYLFECVLVEVMVAV